MREPITHEDGGVAVDLHVWGRGEGGVRMYRERLLTHRCRLRVHLRGRASRLLVLVLLCHAAVAAPGAGLLQHAVYAPRDGERLVGDGGGVDALVRPADLAPCPRDGALLHPDRPAVLDEAEEHGAPRHLLAVAGLAAPGPEALVVGGVPAGEDTVQHLVQVRGVGRQDEELDAVLLAVLQHFEAEARDVPVHLKQHCVLDAAPQQLLLEVLQAGQEADRRLEAVLCHRQQPVDLAGLLSPQHIIRHVLRKVLAPEDQVGVVAARACGSGGRMRLPAAALAMREHVDGKQAGAPSNATTGTRCA